MLFKDRRDVLVLLLALVLLLVSLGSCGSNVAGQPGVQVTPGAEAPDSVRITIEQPTSNKSNPPEVTLSKPSQAQQFYKTTLALPWMPNDIACTDEAGPHYTLTFLRGTRSLARVVARREGCGAVTITGETRDRRASKTFWDQLDQAIYVATPLAQPQSLAIQHTLQGNRPVQTARIADASSAQRLYSALAALPLASPTACNDTLYPEYQLVFQTKDQAIPALLDQHCNTVSLSGNYKSRSGLYTQTPQFKQLFAQTLSKATFAPAQPDGLLVDVNTSSVSSHGPATDMQSARQLYAKVFTLSTGTVGPDCPSGTDKVSGKARWYTLNFTQWGLPVMQLTVYEGTCKLVQPSPGISEGQTLQGDAAFWDLLHRTIHA